MGTKELHLEYFKALVDQCEDIEDWSAWWDKEAEEVRKWLSPGQFLRLKMYPLSTVYEILTENGFKYQIPPHFVHPKFHVPMSIPARWLEKEISITHIDEYFVDWPVGKKAQWQLIKARMVEGDECWYFNSAGDSWKNLVGRSGYAIVRDGKPIDGIITMMN